MLTSTLKFSNAFYFASLLFALLLTGCESNQKADSAPDEQVTLAQAVANYNAKRYTIAYNQADGLSRRLLPPEKEKANLIAGMSTYHLKNMNSAVLHLTPASRSKDTETAGKAAATLGIIYNIRGEYELAARNLLVAYTKLEGSEKCKAAFQLGIAQQRLGQWDKAKQSLFQAMRCGDSLLKDEVRKQLKVSGYSLQVGAYSERENARKWASQIAGKTKKYGVSSATVTMGISPKGKVLYLVRVGDFKNYREAQAAAKKYKLDKAFIVELKHN